MTATKQRGPMNDSGGKQTPPPGTVGEAIEYFSKHRDNFSLPDLPLSLRADILVEEIARLAAIADRYRKDAGRYRACRAMRGKLLDVAFFADTDAEFDAAIDALTQPGARHERAGG